MKLLILGAAGATGSHVVHAATAGGHNVVALVRKPGNSPDLASVETITGDVRDSAVLERAMAGVDAVISTLGVGRARKPQRLIFDASCAVIDAARRTGLRRIIWQSAFGVGDSYPKASALMHLGYSLAPAVFEDKAAGEQMLRASGLDWTIAYPGVLTNSVGTGNPIAVDLEVVNRIGGIPRIARADVAQFLIATAGGDTWNNRVAVLASAARKEKTFLAH